MPKVPPSQTTDESTQSNTPKPTNAVEQKQRVRIRPFDIVALAAIGVVLIFLAITLLSKVALTHEVSDAKVTADRVIKDIQAQNTSDIYNSADKDFQNKNSVAALHSLFKPIGQIYSRTLPSVDSKGVSNTKKAQNVTFIYKYNDLKLPFYLRVDVSKVSNSTKWQLIGIIANTNESALVTK